MQGFLWLLIWAAAAWDTVRSYIDDKPFAPENRAAVG